jgi:hypothetical protein
MGSEGSGFIFRVIPRGYSQSIAVQSTTHLHDIASILPFTFIAFLTLLTESSKTLNLVAATEAAFSFMKTKNRNGAPSELKRRGKKRIVFMISTLAENVFWEIKLAL